MDDYDQKHAMSANIVFHYCGDWRLSGRSGITLAVLVEELANKLGLPNGNYDGSRSPGGAYIWYDDPAKGDYNVMEAASGDIDKYRAELNRGEYAIPSLHMDCGCIGKRERDYYVLLLWTKLVAMQAHLHKQRVPGAILVDNNGVTVTGGETFTYLELHNEALAIVERKPDIAQELFIDEEKIFEDDFFIQGAQKMIVSDGHFDPEDPSLCVPIRPR